jgi:hypothetical protein
MSFRAAYLGACCFLHFAVLPAQSEREAYLFTGIVYDEDLLPVPYTHVIARGTGNADVTDRDGVFQVYIRPTDLLSFYNITTRDTAVVVSVDHPFARVVLTRKVYPIGEAKIFSWGSSYGEFIEEVNRLGTEPTLSEKLSLPVRDDAYVPFDMDEDRLGSLGFFINSPVSFIYYNLSKHERSARKAYRLRRDNELIQWFNELLSRENISSITGLTDQDLEHFIIFLNERMSTTYHNSELDVLTEVHLLWDQYREMERRPQE